MSYTFFMCHLAMHISSNLTPLNKQKNCVLSKAGYPSCLFSLIVKLGKATTLNKLLGVRRRLEEKREKTGDSGSSVTLPTTFPCITPTIYYEDFEMEYQSTTMGIQVTNRMQRTMSNHKRILRKCGCRWKKISTL